MKVKDLIEALEKANPEAMVCVEANDNPVAKTVVQYTFANGETNLYVADNTEYLDEKDEDGNYEVFLDCIKRETIYKEEEYEI